LPPIRAIGKGRDEETVAGERALRTLKQSAHQSATLLVGIEGGVHDDPILHEHHCAGLGEHGFAGIERDDDGLEIVADDFVINLV